MKTQNNNQETGKSQVSKSTLGASAVLFGAVLISLSVNAQDLWKEFSNSASYGKMALVMDGQLNETENADAAFEAINAETADQLFNANPMLMTVAEVEESMEVEGWMIEESFFTDAEQLTANTADAEIANYANMLAMEVEAEEALAIEPWMTEENFFTEAKQYTANTADAEIAKYAEQIVNAIEAEEALAIEPWMTSEEYFNSSEVWISEESLEVESWMLEAENFCNKNRHKQYAVK